jgi:hypothetical protein
MGEDLAMGGKLATRDDGIVNSRGNFPRCLFHLVFLAEGPEGWAWIEPNKLNELIFVVDGGEVRRSPEKAGKRFSRPVRARFPSHDCHKSVLEPSDRRVR